MFSKADSQKIKREFWIEFAQVYPRKWMLYDTKIKDFSFKFYVDNKKAQVTLDIEPRDEQKRKIYFEKIESLKQILFDDFMKNAIFERHFHLETGKEISKIWVEKTGISVFNKNTWPEIFVFFNEKMDAFERFFEEYKDYIEDLELNV
ncbi:DUF4268 domain-containing protein [Flavobacterium antarcticum]|uniref:DUF4268 domain-containing protein n=1 Tax=Flavobacterium antarcticum TaxID=271155 RepID=UPI0003B42AC2|nr:DUF4268 domain-containing protein [Flavobacterium antarcticum]